MGLLDYVFGLIGYAYTDLSGIQKLIFWTDRTTPRILEHASASEVMMAYVSLGSVWLPSCCGTGTDAPRRVKAATHEGHPAPWLAGELDPRGAQSEEAPGFSFTWSCSVRYSRHPAAYVPPRESHGVAQLRHARECQPRGDRPRAS